jgi:ABC-type antimicrobial peptide transport system permease subunit
LNDALKEGSGRATSGQGHRLRQAFGVAEVALALILLIGAGLTVKGFATLATPSPEIEARNLLTFTTRPVERIESMEEKVRRQASGLQYIAGLMAVFGLAALALAAVGVYGVMAYSVNEQRREIGIRMALGASRAAVLSAVMARGLRLTAGGLAIGTSLALVLARLVSSLIYGVNAWDATIFIGVPLALAAIALTASYVPALRATRVDPLVALHYE